MSTDMYTLRATPLITITIPLEVAVMAKHAIIDEAETENHTPEYKALARQAHAIFQAAYDIAPLDYRTPK